MTIRSVLVPLVALALLGTACGRPVVVDTAPAAPVYDGPLFVGVPPDPGDEVADRSGAAGRAVDCDSGVVGGSDGGHPHAGEVTRTAEGAVTAAVGEGYLKLGEAFREARREDDRVLYTYEVGRRVKEASIVHHGRSVDGHTGWYVESSARCDFAEFPDDVTQKLDLQIWTDRSGRRVPTTELVSSPGPEHCDWQRMTFLSVDGGHLQEGRTYLARPESWLYPEWLAEPYVASQPLPADARDTGYERDGHHLWFSADGQWAYVGTATSVQSWPRTVKRLGCA